MIPPYLAVGAMTSSRPLHDKRRAKRSHILLDRRKLARTPID
jgi:hypothetical protein